MPRQLRAALRGAALLAAVCVAAPGSGRAEDSAAGAEAADPVPIRRIVLPPDRINAELERARKGEWVVLPRAEFEEKLRRARAAGDQTPPRLVEARYRASLVTGALVGSLEWHALNSTARPALLPLPSFNLAIRKALVRKGVADTADALLGDLDGRGLGWLVEAAGENVALLDWTARGVAVPEGLRFDLRLPAAALATLDLVLPAERTVEPSDQYLLSGPFPTEHAERRRWHLDCAGRSQLDLVIRRPEPAGRPPLVVAQCEVRQELEPDLVRADFDFHLEALHHPLRELDFRCDPELRPYEVGGRNVDTWELRPATRAGQPSRLTVRFREGQREGAVPVRIRAAAPVRLQSRWTMPNVHLAGAVLRSRTVELRIHPDVRLEDWNSGAFQFAPAPAAAAAGRSRDAWQVISLVGGADGEAPPSARVVLSGAEYRCRQATWWQVGPDASSLTSEITYEVVQGELFRLSCRVPRGWEADRVELASGDALRGWGIAGDGDESILHGELQRPLTAASGPARLVVRLRGRESVGGAVARAVPFPAITPVGPRAAEGVFGISVDSRLEGTVATHATPASPGEHGPWGPQAPRFVYAFHGLPPDGTLHLRPRRDRLHARVTSDVVVGADRCVIQTRLALRPTAEGRTHIDLLLPAANGSEWAWQVESGPAQIRSLQRLRGAEAAVYLLGLGGRPSGLSVLALMLPRLELWRVTFAEAVRGPVLLQGSVAVPQGTSFGHSGAAAGRVDLVIPLPVVIGETRPDGEVSVRLANLDGAEAKTSGIVEARPRAEDASRRAWKMFRYGNTLPWLRLTGRPGTAGDGTGRGEPVIADASVTATLLPDRVRYHYRCEVQGWPQAALPLRLPAEVRLLTVRVGEHWPPRLEPVGQTDGKSLFQVPFPHAAGRQALELTYESPLPAWVVATRLPLLEPDLPVAPTGVRRRWQLPAGIVPLRQERWAEAATGAASAFPTETWQAPADDVPDVSLTAVRRDAVLAGGLALAAAWALFLWCLRATTPRVRVTGLLAVLAYGGLGTLWLPQSVQPLAWYPLVVSLIALSSALLRSAFTAAGEVPGVLKAGMLAALTVLLASPGRADAPALFTVYLLAPQGNPSQVQKVLAGPDLVEQLDELARRTPASVPAAILAAEYTGEVGSDHAAVRARFRVHAFASAEATLALPLGGVQLQSARCDGSDIHAVALRSPREGLSFALPGPGNHELVLEFSVPLAGTGDERELRFTIPEVPQSRLQLRLPAGMRAPFLGAARGAVRLPRPGEPGSELRADLGAVPTVLVRWRQDGLQPRPPSVRVREGYLWDLHPAAADLRGVLQYTVTQGVVSALLIQLPDGLEVRRADVARLPVAAADETPPRVRDWHVSGTGTRRRLHIELQRPVGSGVQVNLDLAARRPLGTLATLPVPAPVDAAVTQGFLAYRADELRAAVKDYLRVSSEDGGGFLPFWRSAGQDDPGPDVRAYAFTRQAGPPLLQLQLARPTAVEASQVDTWRVWPQQASLSAAATLTAPGRNLLLVEWDVPAELAGVEVSGAEVRSWSRTGTRVQVWLQRPCERAEVKLAGWLRLPADRMPPEGYHVLLPPVTVQVPACRHILHVAAADGWTLEPQQKQNLWHLPDSGWIRREHSYVVRATTYEARFRLVPLPPPVVKSLVVAEAGDQKPTVTARISYSLGGEPRPVTVRVRRWEGKELLLEAPGASVRTLGGLGPTTRAWSVSLPPSARDGGRIQLTGQLDARAGRALTLPDVRIDAAGKEDRWIAVVGPELEGDAVRGLVPVPEPAAALPAWRDEAKRIQGSGMAWAVSEDDWQLRLRVKAVDGVPTAAPGGAHAPEPTPDAVDSPAQDNSATSRPASENAGVAGSAPRAARGALRGPWAQSLVWLGFLAAAAWLAATPRRFARLRAVWPEAVVALGAAGWFCIRPSFFFVFVVVIGMLSRLRLVAIWRGLSANSATNSASP